MASGSARPAADDPFYGHYDVQPVDPVDLWTTPPFEATVRDGELYARGAADDKGQVFMHIKAIEACITKMGGLPVNMKFFIEGEEEVGSVHLDEFVRTHKQDLAADVVVISDSPMFDRGIPSICYGSGVSRISRLTFAERRATCTRGHLAALFPTPHSCWRKCSRR